MAFYHKDIKDKWEKCKHRTINFCNINDRLIETPLAMVTNCGNCIANQKEPNIF
jgi:hypothetical protein